MDQRFSFTVGNVLLTMVTCLLPFIISIQYPIYIILDPVEFGNDSILVIVSKTYTVNGHTQGNVLPIYFTSIDIVFKFELLCQVMSHKFKCV